LFIIIVGSSRVTGSAGSVWTKKSALSPDLGLVPRRRGRVFNRDHVGFDVLFNALPACPLAARSLV
jgi:hypothetical protein